MKYKCTTVSLKAFSPKLGQFLPNEFINFYKGTILYFTITKDFVEKCLRKTTNARFHEVLKTKCRMNYNIFIIMGISILIG